MFYLHIIRLLPVVSISHGRTLLLLLTVSRIWASSVWGGGKWRKRSYRGWPEGSTPTTVSHSTSCILSCHPDISERSHRAGLKLDLFSPDNRSQNRTSLIMLYWLIFILTKLKKEWWHVFFWHCIYHTWWHEMTWWQIVCACVRVCVWGGGGPRSVYTVTIWERKASPQIIN